MTLIQVAPRAISVSADGTSAPPGRRRGGSCKAPGWVMRRRLRQRAGQHVNEQAVVERAVRPALVPPHDPDPPEPDPLVDPDRALVRRCRIDRQAVMAPNLEK